MAKVVLRPGETLTIEFEDKEGYDCDGDFEVTFTEDSIAINTSWADDDNREGEIYKVSFGEAPEDMQIKSCMEVGISR